MRGADAAGAGVQFLLCHAHERAPSGLDPASFVSCEVGRDELLPVCAPDAQGRPRFELDAAPRRSAKAALPMLAYSAESGLGRVLRSLHGAALEAPGREVVFTAHLATVLRSLALEGRGLAFLPASLVREDLAAGRLVAAGRRALDHRAERAPLPPPSRIERGGREVLGRGQPGRRLSVATAPFHLPGFK